MAESARETRALDQRGPARWGRGRDRGWMHKGRGRQEMPNKEGGRWRTGREETNPKIASYPGGTHFARVPRGVGLKNGFPAEERRSDIESEHV